MIVCSFSSTSSADQLKRIEFCVISKPDVATPPALDAFPGENNNLFSKNSSIASNVQGMFAASVTHLHPFATKFLASSMFSSFCVAAGIATSHFTSQGRFPAKNLAFGYFLT